MCSKVNAFGEVSGYRIDAKSYVGGFVMKNPYEHSVYVSFGQFIKYRMKPGQTRKFRRALGIWVPDWRKDYG